MALGRLAVPAAIALTAVLAFFTGLLLGGRLGGVGPVLFHATQHWQHQERYGISTFGLPAAEVGHAKPSDEEAITAIHSDSRPRSLADNSSYKVHEVSAGFDSAPVDDGTEEEEEVAIDGEEEEVADEEPAEEAEEAQEVVNEEVERAIATMTLGSVAFQMSLFYLVNHKDEDMRRYSYGVVGETISIFCAVLTFNSCYSWIEDYTHELSENLHMAVLTAMCGFFFIAMEVTVMFSARVRGERAQKHIKLHGKQLQIMEHVLNAKTFGAGAAQMCGAACIRGFGHLQFRAYNFAHSVWLTAAVVPLALLFFAGMMCVSTQVRKCLIYMDGIVDDTELTWVEVAEECENEVCALCTGFLVATVARVLLTDSLPYILLHGFEHSHNLEVSTFQDTAGLLGLGVACAVITIALVLLTYGVADDAINEETISSGCLARSLVLLIKILGFSFSWCLCFGMHLFAIQVAFFKEGIRLRLILALVQSIMSFLVIWLLDFFSDISTSKAFDKAMVTLIETLAVAIGLSWEHAFHECVEITVEYMVEDDNLFKASKDPKYWSMGLSAIIVIMVLPAYRMYIVPIRYSMMEQFEEEMRKEEKKCREHYFEPEASARTVQRPEEQTFQFKSPALGFHETTENGHGL